MVSADASSRQSDLATGYRDISYAYSEQFVPILRSAGVSLAVSTYQAGKLALVGAEGEKLSLSFHNFFRPMGLAVRPGWLAVADRNQVWFLRNAPDVARGMEPKGKYDACFLARSSQLTGEIQAHEMAWSGDELWIANTAFSCLATLHPEYSFVPRWRPPFITALAAEDRCHLNGLAVVDNRPKYVTVLAETDTPQGWRPNKISSGCLIDVDSGRTVARGLAMPHSPRVAHGSLWLLDSGRGRLVRVDPAAGTVETVAEMPGYVRGLAIHGRLAFVGLSKIRETSTFGGVPIAEHREQLKCGVAVVDLMTGGALASLEFRSGVTEISDVAVLPGARMAAMVGPFAVEDGVKMIWTVPEPDRDGPPAVDGCGAGGPSDLVLPSRPDSGET